MLRKIKILYYYFQERLRGKPKSFLALEKYQKKKLLKHLQWVINHSEFYRASLKNQRIKLFSLENFPVINKKIMMENFSKLNTAEINRDQAFQIAAKAEISRNFSSKLNGITIGLSSGTSDNRGLFLASEREQVLWAGTILGKILQGFPWKKYKIAFFLRANSNLYETVRSSRIQFEYFDLLESLENHLIRLNSFQPDILVGPPSLLELLAVQKENALLMINPKKIISVAEVLEEHVSTKLNLVFDQQISQVYQATEGFLAAPCEYGNLHWNSRHIFIEKKYVDSEQVRFIPIITDFYRRVQPIIRYELNDIITESSMPCPCKNVSKVILKIEGRTDDICFAVKKNTEEIFHIFPDFLRQQIMISQSEIEDYHVLQSELSRFLISLRSPDFERSCLKVKNTLTKFFTEESLKIPDFDFREITEEENQKPRDLSLKHRRVRNLIKA